MWMKTEVYPLSESDRHKSKTDMAMVRRYVSKSTPVHPLSMSEREALKTVFKKGVTKCVHR